jgi:hypothetical protein
MTKSFSILCLAFLFACGSDPATGGGSNGSNSSDDPGSGPDPTTGSGSVVIEATKLGQSEAALVDVTCGDEEYFGNTGEEIDVIAPADCVAKIGDAAYTSQFGFPVHMDGNGEYWTAAATDFETVLNDKVNLGLELFKLFEPGEYTCSTSTWLYDASAPDFKGDLVDEGEDPPQPITASNDGQIELQDGATLGIMEDGDYLQIEDDHLILVEADGEQGLYIADATSAIGNSFFEASIVAPGVVVYDLRCDK